MSRYIVTSGSHFDPFTYDELAKPLVQATEAHNAAADAYGKISMETEALRQYITNNRGDYNAKETYDAYVNQLKALQNDLWDKGLTASTRQQLAEARDSYSGQILPIATAIQNRQQRSADYWKLRMENPDMIMGEDPGIAGLDKYVSNPNYGQDYYTYSGNQFQKEVAADAKARADELLRDIEGRLDVDKDSELAGYLRAIKQNGFTSGEVARAYEAVASGADLNSLNVPEKILAEVLVSHLNSTGARGKVSSYEYSRLMEYGHQGLSEAVGKTDVQYLQDQQWQLQKQKELARYQASISKQKSGSGSDKDTKQDNAQIVLNRMLYNVQSGNYPKLAKVHEKVDKKYVDAGGSVTINLPDGGKKPISSSAEMMEEIFNPDIRKNFREQTGLDIALPVVNGWTSKRKKELYVGHNLEGEEVAVTRKLTALEAADLGLSTQDAAVTKEDGSLDKEMTIAYNRARSLYDQYVDNYRKANSDLNLDDYVYRTPEQEAKYRMNEGIGNNVDTSDLDAIDAIRSRVMSNTTGATVFTPDDIHKQARESLGNALAGKLSPYMMTNTKAPAAKATLYYNTVDGSLERAGEGSNDWGKLFPSKKDAKGNFVYDVAANLSHMNAFPEDLINYDTPMVRFTTTMSNGEKMTRASNFGSVMENALTQKHDDYPVWKDLKDVLGIDIPKGESPNSHLDVVGVVRFMMLPFTHPEKALSMTERQGYIWSGLAEEIMNRNNDSGVFRGPIIYAGDDVMPVSIQDIVRNEEFQESLYEGIMAFIDDTFEDVRWSLTVN